MLPPGERTCFNCHAHTIVRTRTVCFSSPRPIRTPSLNTLPCVHAAPIKEWSTPGLTGLLRGKSYLGVYFALRCFQRLSRPNLATRHLLAAEQPAHPRLVHPGPPVL